MEILEVLLENVTMVELMFIGLVAEVLAILFLVEARLRLARLFGLITKEKYQQSIDGKNGHSKLKKGITGVYFMAAIFIFIGTGFSIHWQVDRSVKVWQQGKLGQLESEVKLISENFLKEKDIRDMCIGVIKKDKRYLSCLSQSQASNATVLDGSSIFEIGSISKTFTYAAMIKVLEKHNIEINSSIRSFLPKNITEQNPAIASITWQQLATHTSGLSRMPMAWNWTSVKVAFAANTLGNPAEYFTTDYVYEYLLSETLEDQRAVKASYSNLAVGLLGLLLSDLEEKSYQQMIQDLIISPLHMDATTAGIALNTDKAIDGYGQYRRIGSLVISAIADQTVFSDALAGAGSVNSSISDMMIYLSNSMQEYKRPIFQNASYTSSFNDTVSVNLGWIVKDMSQELSENIVMHNGATGGFRSYLGFSESSDVGVVILSNGSRSVDSMGVDILKVLINVASQNNALADLTSASALNDLVAAAK